VPWARAGTDPLLLRWLNSQARSLVRPGCRAVVVGCGLGDDVVELGERGFDVVGFDISPCAVHWAAQRHPRHAERFVVADLLAPPTRLLKRFDLVVEIRTIQSLAPCARCAVAAAVANLLCPRGVLLAIARGRDGSRPLDEFVSQPWPLTRAELVELFEPHGLGTLNGANGIEEVVEPGRDGAPPVQRLCATFVRAE